MSKRMAALILVLALWGGVFAAEHPVYTVKKTTVPIKVDGALDEGAWTNVEAVPLVDNTTGEDVGPATLARMLYDDEYLYVSFVCEDSNVWATMTERDDRLWTEEVVEVFLQPDPDQPSYIEIEVNPLGTLIDIYLLDIRKPVRYESWNAAGIQWAVEVDGTVNGEPGDSGWSCEMAIPLADAVTAPNIPPFPGDRWKANLYRVEQKPKRAGLAWSPTMKRDFHVPAEFGEILFSSESAR